MPLHAIGLLWQMPGDVVDTHSPHPTPYRSVTRLTTDRNGVCDGKGPDRVPGKPTHCADEEAEVCHGEASAPNL